MQMEPEKVYTALANINKDMSEGFGEVYKKIDTKFDSCDKRLGRVETIIAVKKAICEKEQKRKDYWKWIIRAASVMGIGALFGILWKLIVFGSKLP